MLVSGMVLNSFSAFFFGNDKKSRRVLRWDYHGFSLSRGGSLGDGGGSLGDALP